MALGNQQYPDISVGPNGNFIITWQDSRGNDDNIYSRRYYAGIENIGYLESVSIPLGPYMHWSALTINKTEPINSYLNTSIIDNATNQTIEGFDNIRDNGTIDISSIDFHEHPVIRLKATFQGNGSNTPVLHSWGINWTNDDPTLGEPLSASVVNRTCSLNISIPAHDAEERAADLDFTVQCKPHLSNTWESLTEVLFNSTCFYINFTPSIDAVTGSYDFRFNLTDSPGLSTGWIQYDNLVTVLNNLPEISDEFVSVTFSENVTKIISLAPYGKDVEDESGELMWSCNASTIDTKYIDVSIEGSSLTVSPVHGVSGITTFQLMLLDSNGGTCSRFISVTIVPDNEWLAVDLESPTNNTIQKNSSVTLVWSTVSTDPFVQVYFDIYLSTNLGEVLSLSTDSYQGKTYDEFYYMVGLKNGTYFWKVVPSNTTTTGICSQKYCTFNISRTNESPATGWYDITIGPILDGDEKPVSEVWVNFTYNGSLYSGLTGSNGEAVISVFVLPMIPENTTISAQKRNISIMWKWGEIIPRFTKVVTPGDDDVEDDSDDDVSGNDDINDDDISDDDDTDSNPDADKGLSGMVKGLIVGGIVLVLIAITMVVIVLRKKKKGTDEPEPSETTSIQQEPTESMIPAAVSQPPATPQSSAQYYPSPSLPLPETLIMAVQSPTDESEQLALPPEATPGVEVLLPPSAPPVTDSTIPALPLETKATPSTYKDFISSESTFQPITTTMTNIVPNYTITHKIGAGGFGTVYKAFHISRKNVAIKLPKMLDETIDASVLQKFQEEADIWRKLRHKNIVEFIDGNIVPCPYLAIELMDGGNLKQLVSKYQLSIGEAVYIMVQILDGMSYAHRMATIHRDLKPENILFTIDGIPKISDWGIGKFMGSMSTEKTMGMKGTMLYSAPEQISKAKFGQVDWTTDIFQLGIVFYEMITRQHPFFDEDPVGIIGKITGEDPRPPSEINPRIPRELDNIIMTALQKDKAKRWRSADIMHHELKRLLEG